MSRFPVIYSAEDAIAFLTAEKIPFEIPSYTKMGDPMIVIRKAGKGRPVMITAGAHANEPSGVSAAFALARDWDYEYPLVVVPLRDPMGCRPYAKNLSKVLGREITFNTYEELTDILMKNADEVYCNDGDFVLAEINGVLFNNFRQVIDDMDAIRGTALMNDFLKKNPQLLDKLVDKRVVSKANSTERAETVGQYGRCMNGDIAYYGVFCNFNRRFGYDDAPEEVKVVQRVFDEVQPQFMLDLHEGFGQSYYLFNANYTVSDRAKVFASEMSRALAKVGEPIHASDIEANSPGFLEHYFEPVSGVIADRAFGDYKPVKNVPMYKQPQGDTFGAYAATAGCPSFSIEAGNNTTMENRVNVQITGARAMLDALVAGA